MTLADDMVLVDPPSANLPSAPLGRWELLGVLGAGIGIAGLVEVGRAGAPLTPGWVLAPVVVAAWLVGGVALLRRACPLGRRALAGATAASVAYLGAAVRLDSAHSTAARVAFAIGVLVLPALGLHLLLSLPDGRLTTSGRQVTAACGYGLAAITAGVWLAGDATAIGGPTLVLAALAGVVGAVPANHRYRATVGLARQRLQWIGCAMAVAAEVGLVALALRILTGWPQHTLLVVAAGSLTIPLALVASATPLVTRVDRLLVATVSVTGLTGVVLGVYVVVVVGLGRSPSSSERQVLILSMLAASVAALLYLPARNRLGEWPTGWCTGSGTRRTRRSRPSVHDCLVPSPWTNCCSSWWSRSRRR